MAKRPVTLTGVVAGHVSLEIEGFDRIYLNGWVPALQTPGQIAGWLRYRGFPIASPAALGKNKELFVQAVRRYADGNGIGWVRFAKGDRKIEVMQPYPGAAEAAGVPAVVAIGEAREFQWVFDATKKTGPDGGVRFKFWRGERLVTCYYFYIWDERCGAGFIKVCTYAPYPVKVWLNGHDIARRKAIAAGLEVTPLANGFASASDPVRLQELRDSVQAGTLQVFSGRWMSRIPVPLTQHDREHGCWWQLSMRQAGVSRTLVSARSPPGPHGLRGAAGREHEPGPAGERAGHLRLQGSPAGELGVRHPAAQPLRSGHGEPVLQALPDQGLPQRGPRAESRDGD